MGVGTRLDDRQIFALTTLGVGIALALIDADADIADGDTVSVDVRGRALDCEVVKPPFVDVKTR